MSDAGFHCIAPDWIGFGFSDKPYPGYGFDYTGSYSSHCLFLNTNLILFDKNRGLMHSKPIATEKEFHDEFDKLLEVLGVECPFLLVVQV